MRRNAAVFDNTLWMPLRTPNPARALRPAQRAWVTLLATTVTLLAVIALAALG